MECDESALTGESLPAEKTKFDEAYSGSTVLKGDMRAVVKLTGFNTYIGKTAKLVDETKEKSHFEKAVIKIGNYLIVLAGILVAVIIMMALFRHDNFLETLRFAMVLTVASIPVALPAILTVTMAVGAVNLTKKGAIVSKLASIEELAGVDVLCSDKTGTLTKNKLTPSNPISAGNFSENDVLIYACLASQRDVNDAIDDAIFKAVENKREISDSLASYKTVNFVPFDPVIKRSEAEVSLSDSQPFKVTKGAPQIIFNLIDDKDFNRKDWEEKVNELAGKGYRVLGVAAQLENKGWKFIGLTPLFDPPRDDSAETIKQANEMGIDVKMVTGDNRAIAKEIAKKLGMKSNILEADKLNSIATHDLEDMVEKADGFAEVFPEHKYSIIKLLQKLKHFVGMTGDGVNDAPALRKADCGIAVEGATDAAKSAASIVLTQPGISVIIDAVKEARKIFQRMNSYGIYRIAETIRVLIFITLSILVFNFYPVTAAMIVLLALLNDAPIIAIAYDNVKYSNKPEKWDMHLVFGLGALLGSSGVVFTFVLLFIGKDLLHLNANILQTFIFLKLAVAGHLTIFVSRTRGRFWTIKPSGALLWSAVITKVLATFFAVYGWFVAPIGWELAFMVWGFSIALFLINDSLKVFFYKFLYAR